MKKKCDNFPFAIYRLYLTYEELKFGAQGVIRLYRESSLYLTYEELKLSIFGSNLSKLDGLYLTYEELK